MAMGLLNFLPDDPAKKEAARQGLLSLGAAMLQGRGNFGQVVGQGLGAGVQGYQGGLDNHRQAMLGKEQAERWRLENEANRDAISRPGRIAAAIAGPQAESGAPATAPQGTQSQSMGAPAQNAAPAPVTSSAALYRARGDRLAAQGFLKEAEGFYKLAQDMTPKLKAQEVRTVNGKRVMANVYEDGRTETVDGYAPAEKLTFQNTGGATVALDPYTGLPVNSIANTQSPESIASGRIAMRGQNMTDARARETIAQGGKAPVGYRFKADGSMEAIPGGPADLKNGAEAVKKTNDAKDVLGLLDEVDVLLPQGTSGYLGTGVDALVGAAGMSTKGAQATAQLKAIEGALISKMPKMSGPQSDKDVLLYKQMAGQVGDSTIPVAQREAASRMIRRLNEKYAGMEEGSSNKQDAKPSQGSPTRIKNAADYAKIPSGAEYITPDGIKKRKP